jgi:hypothetical protein
VRTTLTEQQHRGSSRRPQPLQERDVPTFDNQCRPVADDGTYGAHHDAGGPLRPKVRPGGRGTCYWAPVRSLTGRAHAPIRIDPIGAPSSNVR